MATSSGEQSPFENNRSSHGSLDLKQLESWLKFVENEALLHVEDVQLQNTEVSNVRPVTKSSKRPRIAPVRVYVEEWPEVQVKLDNTITPRIRSGRMLSVIGGSPITQQQAVELRKIVYGSSTHSFSKDWKRACFTFNSSNSPFPYGLYAERNGSRGVLMAVQGFIIKNLVFKDGKPDMLNSSILQPSSWHCKEALVRSLSEMLWMAGEKKQCTVCLPQESVLFGPTSQYKYDGITEKLHLFQFQKYEDLEMFIKRHLNFFEQPTHSGAILFLYSMVLSHTIPKCSADYGEGDLQLLTDYEECTQSLVNLLLTGQAVRYLHNGSIVYGDSGDVLTKPQAGIKERNYVGFLFWHRDENDRKRTQHDNLSNINVLCLEGRTRCSGRVGSMLKTPRLPIWVTLVNGQFGLLFSTNPDLISDWRVEHRFVLHYYTGLSSQQQAAKLNVDTRFGQKSRSLMNKEEERKLPALQKCIMTKWYGAEVNWNGVTPFV